ncbi:VOC family protein [Caenimonas koreensis]|uniref:VOC family protein n=1 Tax=Caenimonas koreensis DSM 17982 TaxID=1121255 RepID=A0A844AYG9_9BURK|nr:VOC family protein [Caenimonas koreensis]MRD49405.1 VOC family protein [Caenimonas koreensis DSM 17982]
MESRIDHLVVVAHSLEQGVAWCEATLSVTPGPGGKHPLMGTHNRLLRIDSPAYPSAYFEIIAIDSDTIAPAHKRWFDMDDAALRDAVRQQPRLVHFVASTPDAAAAIDALAQHGIDRGPLLKAERPVASGMLRWQISVRADGQRLFQGGLPAIIEWSGAHPTDAMPVSALTLQSLTVTHPRGDALRAAHRAIGLQGVAVETGAANLSATLLTPRGPITIESAGV